MALASAGILQTHAQARAGEIFSGAGRVEKKELRVSQRGKRWVTRARDAGAMAALVHWYFVARHGPGASNIPKPLLIDGTANNGGNTVAFALSHCFSAVVAVEENKEDFAVLEHNLRVYGFSAPAVLALRDNVVTWLRAGGPCVQQSRALFLDPVWQKSDLQGLWLTGPEGSRVDVVEVLDDYWTPALNRLVALKCPEWYDTGTLVAVLRTKWGRRVAVDKYRFPAPAPGRTRRGRRKARARVACCLVVVYPGMWPLFADKTLGLHRVPRQVIVACAE